MLDNIRIKISTQGSTYEFSSALECDELSAKVINTDERLTLSISPKKELVFKEIKATAFLPITVDDRIFVNGYQSWTDSREYTIDEHTRGIDHIPSPLVQKYNFDKYGDYNFVKYKNKEGCFHGFTYAYVRSAEEYRLMGSLSERNGFVLICINAAKDKVTFKLECEDAAYGEEFDALDIYLGNGSESGVFDRYFELMSVPAPIAKPVFGYTSWYNHYQNISDDKLSNDLDAIISSEHRQDIFQIDDGYQTAVGDWLSLDKAKFPEGIKKISDRIHDNGMLSGLWLAPFVCEKTSDIYNNKKDWLLYDKNGNEVPAGCNWSGSYVLDFYNDEVREYLREVFRTVLDDWGFDLVKLDFLYAVCEIPQHGRSRGQIMCEAMDFLRECVGDKLILGCGVPLGAAFGKVDYCRIGCDVGLTWDDNLVMRLTHRERVSTKNSMMNTIFRRQLDGRAFLNDPDVYLLRDENISMAHCQKQSLSIINHLFGSVYFTSDDISSYSDKQKRMLKTARRMVKADLKSVDYNLGRVTLLFDDCGKQRHIILLPDGRLE
ncbi:MAG: alpha-galactosidase [Ruminococcus sp.]|nr:alpha-galactosidase [Ruminococcus sp.]